MIDEEDCPICLSPMDETICEECPMCKTLVDGAITMVDCCKKQFHTRCLKQCMTVKSECPLCRAKDCVVVQIETHEEYNNKIKMYASIFIQVCALTVVGFILLKYKLHW